MDLTCPQCNQNQVRKVSGLYKEQGALGQRLAPPEAPSYENPWGNGPILHRQIGFPMALGLVVLLAGILVSCSSIGWGLLLVFVGLIIIVGLIWSRSKTTAARRAAVEKENPRWQSAYQRWNQLYYCQTCDGLYVPGSPGPLMTEEEASQFVHRGSR